MEMCVHGQWFGWVTPLKPTTFERKVSPSVPPTPQPPRTGVVALGNRSTHTCAAMAPPQSASTPWFSPNQLYFGLDVECVATGTTHDARAVAQIGLVDAWERPLLNLVVKPDQPVVSHLSPLTGLSAEILEQYGMHFTQAMQMLRQCLPKEAVLVGQSIHTDVKWLGLQEGVDFQGMIDLSGIWRVWNTKYNSWSVFSQDHCLAALLGIKVGDAHDALGDALKSIRLFNFYRQLQDQPHEIEKAKESLLKFEPEPSFAKKHPVFDGVCMGNRKTCTCGAPFLTFG